MPAQVSSFDEFHQRAQRSPELLGKLRDHQCASDSDYVDHVVTIAAQLDVVLDADQVRHELMTARRGWLERWMD